jgi:putative transposase
MIDPQDKEIAILRQCELLGLCRSTYYYQPAGEKPLNLELMRIIDEQYTKTPFYGVPRMTQVLLNMGYPIGHKRVERLMHIMGLSAIYPKKNLSKPGEGHRKFPYLLRGFNIVRPNQVWATDITYIRLHTGFLYLVAIMDWYSRYVLSWRLSNSLDSLFCIEALHEALAKQQPEIFNSDQGCQFTSDKFLSVLENRRIRISMDGRGRAMDNIMIERLWRTVKYEEVYLKDYQKVREAFAGLSNYFQFYNNERIHQSLGYDTPAMVYFGQSKREPWRDKINRPPGEVAPASYGLLRDPSEAGATSPGSATLTL